MYLIYVAFGVTMLPNADTGTYESSSTMRWDKNMFAANLTFARIGSRISLDMLISMRRVSVFFYFAKLKTLKT